ncbi:MAG: hypothetical protein EAZ57_01215 [Cytophagales bacterium]|nr:MAG: hypothetical protein EAZ67_02060 [Cytophagales bacterium]TAF62069.1 MAG: hypothetical protein EAZ57_01215 [Cytophagales bacterium]
MNGVIKIGAVTSLCFLSCCVQVREGESKIKMPDSVNASMQVPPNSAPSLENLPERKAKFLWREDRSNAELGTVVNEIVINEKLCNSLSDAERAALGYVVTFIGSDCNWDGQANKDFNNLKCLANNALGLGYQCSEEHLDFLRRWFRNDEASLDALKSCASVPMTATTQETFDFINLKVKDNMISVEFAVTGFCMNSGESWSWTGTNHFLFEDNGLMLTKKEESEVSKHSQKK